MPIHRAHRKYLQFILEGVVYEFIFHYQDMQVIVATAALYGMGINKHNIRKVSHTWANKIYKLSFYLTSLSLNYCHIIVVSLFLF